MSKPVLGRGLSALLGGNSSTAKTAFDSVPPAANLPPADQRERIERVNISRIHPCPFQPRQDFSEESLRELADSIKEKGIVQPLIVRLRGNDFELIAGERRWRAARLVGLAEIPIIVRQADDRAVLELALIENLQRENLNPIEEALGYFQLIESFQLKQEEAATKVGKSRAVVANALRLLKLAPELQTYLREGKISVGHAKVILGLENAAQQKLAVGRILKNSLNVRQTEQLIAALQNDSGNLKSSKNKNPVSLDAHVVDLQNKLQERFGTKVHLRYRQGKGALEIKFFDDDDLERILKIAGISLD
ncbi:MAG: ParB/RepB/Spo0J family partition protein [Verrucomicrobiota bacterium]|nr:ParB/RepB/Spo0J family partition protein [Verrucomicrobiota bacterium]